MSLKIAFCAGHGIHTAGKRTPDNEREWTFNNKVAVSFEKEIKKYENVELLRTDDRSGKKDVLLRTRTDKANDWKADVYISFHHNAHLGVWGNHTGVEVYHHRNSTKGKEIAGKVLEAVVKVYGLRNRGLKTNNLHITRETKMPAVLIEGGFMDSTVDIKKLRNDKVLENAGKEIAQVVATHYKLKKKKTTNNKENNTLYRVQTGAFRQKRNADNLVNRLKRAGFDTYMVKEGNLYKVQVGAYSERKNANNMANRLRRSGFSVYITTNSGSPVSSPSKPKPKVKELKVGSKVRVKKGARDYNGTSLANFVYNNTYNVIQINGNRVVLGGIMTAIHKNNLEVI